MSFKRPFVIVLFSFSLCVLTQAGSKPVLHRPATYTKPAWIKLFDGKTLNGWHLFNHNGPPANWTVEDGAIVCHGFKGPSGSCDLVSHRSFANFELIWDWKVHKGSNSGMFYHVQEGPQYNRPSGTSPEYQLIDEQNYPVKLEPDQLSGADYAMYAPINRRKLKPTGAWNTSKIIFNNGHVEHWLNGKLILQFEAWSDDWLKRKAAGKWKDFPDYGTFRSGLIGMQDHNESRTYFNNIRIREL